MTATQLIADVTATAAAATPAPPTPSGAQMTATQLIADVTATAAAATPAPPTLSAFQMTATQVIQDATAMALQAGSATPRMTETARPTFTLTPSATFTATADYGATATQVVADATATAAALEAEAPDITLPVPEGWADPRRIDAHTFYLADGTAELFVYRGDTAFFETRWGIPADETRVLHAASAIVRLTGGKKTAFDVRLQMVTIQVPDEDVQGVIYLLARPEADGWLLVSASAPAASFGAYKTEVFDPLANELAGAVSGAEAQEPDAATPAPTETPVPPLTAIPSGAAIVPSDVALTAQRSARLALALDVPEGWHRVADDEMNDPDMGLHVELFFADPADAERPNETPARPALAVMRFQDDQFLMTGGVATPGDLMVQLMDIEREAIAAFDGADYPAARAMFEEPGMVGVLYALQLADDDWVLVLLSVPPGDNVALWDEVVLMPVVRSVAVLADAPGTES